MNTRDSSWRRAQESARRNATKGRLLVKIFYARPVGRALRRYLESNGNVLAGGVAYYSLASIAAALVLAVTIASFVVIGNETMRDGIVDFLGNAIPGIFTTDDGQTGLIDPSTLSPTPMSGVVGLIAFLVLIYTATRYMRGMRAATQTMLGKASAKVIPGTLSDVIALVALALTAVVAAGFQIVAGSLANHVAGWIGGADLTAATVRAVAAVAGLAANVAFVAIVFLVLGSARAPAKILVPTIGLTALAIAVLQLASSYFVTAASSNTVLAPFAAVIAVLLFVDFASRGMLIAAAWIGAAAGGAVGNVAVGLLPSPARRTRKTVTTRRATGSKEPPSTSQGDV